MLTFVRTLVLLQKVFLDLLCHRLQAQRNQIAESNFSTSAQDLLHLLDGDLHLNNQDLHMRNYETATHIWQLDIAIRSRDRDRLKKEQDGLQLLRLDIPFTTYTQLLAKFLLNVNMVIWEEQRKLSGWSSGGSPGKRNSSSAVKEACRACIVVIVRVLPHPSWSKYEN